MSVDVSMQFGRPPGTARGTFEKRTTITYTKSGVTLTLVFHRIDSVVYVAAYSSGTMNIARSWTQIADSIDEDFIPSNISIAGIATIGGSCGLVVPDSDTSISKGGGAYFPRGCVLFLGTASSVWLQGSGFYLMDNS